MRNTITQDNVRKRRQDDRRRTDRRHRVGALLSVPLCLGIGEHTGGSPVQIYETTTELGDKIDYERQNRRSTVCFCDVRVRLVSECESAGITRQFHEFVYDVQDPGGESTTLDHDRVEGGSADQSHKT